MKITKSQLKKIIREELQRALSEQTDISRVEGVDAMPAGEEFVGPQDPIEQWLQGGTEARRRAVERGAPDWWAGDGGVADDLQAMATDIKTRFETIEGRLKRLEPPKV